MSHGRYQRDRYPKEVIVERLESAIVQSNIPILGYMKRGRTIHVTTRNPQDAKALARIFRDLGAKPSTSRGVNVEATATQSSI